MDTKERIELSKLIKEYDAEDNTSKIRELKHSDKIRVDVGVIESLKKKYARMYKSNIGQFKSIAAKQASFLYDNYTIIFNKLIKGELNLNILGNLLQVLHKIEVGELDQHEGSYQVGTILKKMYIDSVIQQDEKAKQKDAKLDSRKSEPRYKNVSWSQFKSENAE